MRNNFKFQISDFRFETSNPKSQIPNPKFCPLSPVPCSLSPRRRRGGFTLAELLIAITILTILSGLGLSAYTGAIHLARDQRTRSQIDKIDTLIMERWEGYRTRAVPIKIPAGTSPRIAAMARLNALRDLMRMELPDRMSDVMNGPCNYDGVSLKMATPSLWNSYRRRTWRQLGTTGAFGGWTPEHQGAECLYLILSTIRDGDKAALDYFSADEIGDTDGDEMPEVLDGWGTPIEFIRWPAGYVEQPGPDGAWGNLSSDDDANGTPDDLTEAGWPGTDDVVMLTMQTRKYWLAPDPFDPVKVHAGTSPPGPTTLFGTAFTPGYLLHPLVVSAGRDKEHDIVFDADPALSARLQYSPVAIAANFPNPYVLVTTTLGGSVVSVSVGTPGDANNDGEPNYFDNITNHDQTSQ